MSWINSGRTLENVAHLEASTFSKDHDVTSHRTVWGADEIYHFAFLRAKDVAHPDPVLKSALGDIQLLGLALARERAMLASSSGSRDRWYPRERTLGQRQPVGCAAL